MKKSYTFHADNLLYTQKLFPVNQSINYDEDKFLPGKHIIQNLINYSKSLNIIKLQSIGTFGLISN
jgi:hypothetical protein